MGRSVTIIPGRAFVEEEIYAGEQRFRWSCSCKLEESWSVRKSTRDVWTALEAFRQHWSTVHKDEWRPLIDWTKIGEKVHWMITGQEMQKNIFEHLTAVPSFNFENTEQEKVGMSRFDDIQARLRELEKEAAKYARFERVDPWPVGTVVVYDQEATTGEKYTYAVLKCGNEKWYWTGHGVFTKSGASYDHLVEHLAHDRTSSIRVAVPDDFKPLFSETTEEPTTPVAKDAAPESTGVFIPRLSEK
jgi:hypothetical protein